MAFPTTSVLDDFNTGASQNLRGRSGWHATNVWNTGDGNWKTDAVPTYAGGQGTAGIKSAYWGTNPLADCEAYFDWDSALGLDSTILLLRHVFSAGVANGGYLARIGFSGSISIETYDTTVLASGSFASPAVGDSYGFEAIGNQLTVYKKPSGGSWGTDLGGGTLTVSDSTYTAAGSIGMACSAFESVQVSDFGGGSVVGGVAATVTPYKPMLIQQGR